MSLFPYLGGKTKLAKTIIQLFPEHQTYVEVFAGAANILFKKEPSKVEVINDINIEIATLYRVAQNHLEEFIRFFKWALVSRNEFERMLESNPETLTDIQRAVRFFYLQKCNFGGKVVNQSFGYSKVSPPRLNLLRIEEDLSAAHLRLSRALIECLPYKDILKRYDSENSLFYLDPPYYNCENDYGKNIFAKDDFAKLANILREIKGKFVLSLNDKPEVRRIFGEFNMKEVQVRYSIGNFSKSGDGVFRELIIMNY